MIISFIEILVFHRNPGFKCKDSTLTEDLMKESNLYASSRAGILGDLFKDVLFRGFVAPALQVQGIKEQRWNPRINTMGAISDIDNFRRNPI